MIGRPTGTEIDPAAVAQLRAEPFPHAVFGADTLLSGAEVARLVATAPVAPTTSRRAAGGDKTYEVTMLTLYDRGSWAPQLSELDASWRSLAHRFADTGYAERLAGLLGVPPGPVELELRLTEYRVGGWMSRHTDRPDKLFSQNIYLCPDWSPAWGGGLALYADEHQPDAAAVFVPGAGTSLAFARSDRSWHEVLPVAADAALPRRALLLHGYRPDA